jgi:broad specificity phosphatase PhoE
MTTLYLVRHGQTDWNLNGLYQGHSDIPLNETGKQQAMEAVQSQNGITYEAIYASDLTRAQQTASYFAEKAGLPIKTDARLREVFMGKWEGMSFDDIRATYPELVVKRMEKPTRFAPPDGENILDLAKRIILVTDDICTAYPDGKVLIVTHGLSMGTLYCLANDIDLDKSFEYLPGNAEIREVKWTAGKVTLPRD